MTDKTKDVYEDKIRVADMVERYAAAADSDEARAAVVAELAVELGKAPRSVIAKLVSEKVYIAKTRKTKSGSVIRTKAQLVDDLIEALGVELTESEASSLEKATKTTLRKLIDSMTVEDENSKEDVNSESDSKVESDEELEREDNAEISDAQ